MSCHLLLGVNRVPCLHRPIITRIPCEARCPKPVGAARSDVGGSSKRPEELADVLDKKLWFLECGEVSAARHVGPVHDVEESLAVPPRRAEQLLRECCDTRRHPDSTAGRP